MSEQPDGMEAFRASLHTFVVNLAEAIRQTVEAALPLLQSISEALWNVYREAGMPYGETQEGLLQWVEDMGKIKRHEAKIECILQHHDTLISARQLGEAIRKRRAEEAQE